MAAQTDPLASLAQRGFVIWNTAGVQQVLQPRKLNDPETVTSILSRLQTIFGEDLH